jgi:hypothetical protein
MDVITYRRLDHLAVFSGNSNPIPFLALPRSMLLMSQILGLYYKTCPSAFFLEKKNLHRIFDLTYVFARNPC